MIFKLGWMGQKNSVYTDFSCEVIRIIDNNFAVIDNTIA